MSGLDNKYVSQTLTKLTPPEGLLSIFICRAGRLGLYASSVYIEPR